MPMAASAAARAPPALPPEAAVLKDQGNKALQEKRHADAVDLYTTALGSAPDSAVLLSNRAEARLRLEQWDGALADADAALRVDGAYAKAHFRRAAALAALRRPAEATEAYGGALGLKGADDALLRRRIDEVSAAAWPVAVRRFAGLGNALVATRCVVPGDVAVSERPVLSWDNAAPADPRVAAALARHGLASSLGGAAALVFHATMRAALTQYQLDMVRDLSVPEFDLTAAPHMVKWVNAARDIAAEAPELFSSDPAFVARLMLAAKTNAHHVAELGADGQERGGVFRVASKLSHSCCPSTVYHMVDGQVRFTAMRSVGAGELVSFSYRGELDWLQESNRRRQEDLRTQHFFVCRCTRCEKDDEARGIRCDCGPKGVRIWRGAYPAAGDDAADGCGWRCDECTRSFGDNAMAAALAAEQRLEQQTDELDAATNKVTNMYTELKAALTEAEQVLGQRHWVYGRLCKRLSTYFAAMLKGGGGVVAAQLAVGFAAQYLAHLSASGTWRHAATLPAHFAAITALRVADVDGAEEEPAMPGAAPGAPTVVDAARALLRFACPLLKAVYGKTDVTTSKALAAAACHDAYSTEPAPRHPRDPAALLPAPPPPAALFAAWEAQVVRLVAAGAPAS